MNVLLIFISFLPIFLLGFYIYKKDTEKESKRLLAILFSSGLLSSALVVVFNSILFSLFPDFYISYSYSKYNYLQIFILVFLEIALVEETLKWAMVRVIGYKNKRFDQLYDIIVYAVFVALGFAFFENVFYVMYGGLQTGILRAVLAVPGHAAFGVFMGYFLGKARVDEKNENYQSYNKNMVLSLIIPISLHAIYNYCLLIGSEFLIIIFLIFIISIYFVALSKINEVSKNNETL